MILPYIIVASATQETTRLEALLGVWPAFAALFLMCLWVYFWDRRFRHGKV